MGTATNATHREPWNKGKIVGQKAPFKLKDIWALRVRLQMENRVRELALFNLGIDSKLRGCDLIALKVRDVCHGDQVASRAVVMQHKNQRPVQFEITPAARDAVQKWIKTAGLKSDDFLFPSRLRDSPHLGTRQYARMAATPTPRSARALLQRIDAADGDENPNLPWVLQGLMAALVGLRQGEEARRLAARACRAGNRLGVLNILPELPAIAALLNRFEAAALLIGHARQRREAQGVKLDAQQRSRLARAQAAASEKLGTARVEALLEAGQVLTDEAVVTLLAEAD
jgi:hypothetical protein